MNSSGAVEDKTASLIEEISEQLASKLPTKPRAIVLTGSFARNEGSVLLASNRFRVLGDMEFMVVFPTGVARGPLQVSLDQQAKQLKEEFASRGTDCDLEFRAITSEYFYALRPQIFGYELLVHGQTVWGDPSVLSVIQKFSREAIPRWDAWRMLHNRIIEQLEWFDQSTACPDKVLRLHYQIIKCYLDLATTLLIFAGKYEDTYASRSVALSKWADEAGAYRGLEFLPELARRVKACTAFKLDPNTSAMPLGVRFQFEDTELLSSDLRRAVLELVPLLRQIWRWEAAMLARISNAADETDESLQTAVLRSQPIAEKLRGWARLALMPTLRRERGFFSNFSRLALQGSPRYLVYAVAAPLYFKLPALVSDQLTEDALTRSDRLLPIRFEDSKNESRAWWRLRREVLTGYRVFLRNHFA
jgi:hypothetical protein